MSMFEGLLRQPLTPLYVLLFWLGAVLGAPAYALLDGASWSATRIVRIDGREFVTRVNHTRLQERIVTDVAGVELTLILRSDRNVAWQLMPLMMVYAEADVSRMDTPANVRIVEAEPLGEEAVGGQSAMKYRALFQTRDGTRHEGHFWQNAAGVHVKERFPVTDRAGRTRLIELELRDLRVGAQQPGLFEVPTGYRLIDVDIGSVLGELFGF